MCTLLLNLIKVKIIVWNNQTEKSRKRKPIRLRCVVSVVWQRVGTGLATGRTIIQVLLLSNYSLVKFLQILMMKVGCNLLTH